MRIQKRLMTTALCVWASSAACYVAAINGQRKAAIPAVILSYLGLLFWAKATPPE